MSDVSVADEPSAPVALENRAGAQAADGAPRGLPEGHTGQESARATRLLFVGQLVGKFLRFATDLVIGRMLGPSGLGTVAASMSVVQIASEIGLVGSHRAVLRYASTGSRHDRSRATRWGIAIAALVSAVLTSALFVFRETVRAALFPSGPTWIVPAFATTIPMIAIASVLQFRARASRRFVADALIGNIGRNGFPFAITMILLFLGYGLLGATIGYVAGIGATLLLAVVLYRRGEADEGTSSVSLRRFVGTAIPLAFASASILLMNELDKVMLAIFRPESEVGIYNASFRISRQTILLLPALNAAISPWVAPLLADGRLDDLRRLYRQTTKWSLAAGWSAGLLFVVFARDCLSLFGAAYLSGVTTLALLSAGQALNAAVGNAGVVLQFSGNERKEFEIGAWGIAANVVLNLALIPRFGAPGAAIATIASLLLIALWRLVCVRAVLGCFPYDQETLSVILGGMLAIAVAWGVRTLLVVWGAAVPVGLAGGVLAMAGTWLLLLRVVGISEEEAALLKLPAGWVRRRDA